MIKKISYLLILTAFFSFAVSPESQASKTGLKEGASSLIIPGWGQYQNGEFESETGKIKAGAMIALEIAAIITTSVVGGVAGYPAVWAGIGIFIANHVWSSFDAFLNAGKDPGLALGTASPSDKVDSK